MHDFFSKDKGEMPKELLLRRINGLPAAIGGNTGISMIFPRSQSITFEAIGNTAGRWFDSVVNCLRPHR
jgi:hypothetical protein